LVPCQITLSCAVNHGTQAYTMCPCLLTYCTCLCPWCHISTSLYRM